MSPWENSSPLTQGPDSHPRPPPPSRPFRAGNPEPSGKRKKFIISTIMSTSMLALKTVRLESKVPPRKSWIHVFHLLEQCQRSTISNYSERGSPEVIA